MNEKSLCSLREFWKLKVEEWQTSGKSCLMWCKEHDIPYKKFLYWKSLFTQVAKETLSKSAFVELKPQKPQLSGIEIVCNDFTVAVQQGFDQETLLQTLTAIKRLKC